MSDVALQLEKELLGDRVAFPCGCVVDIILVYPGKTWVRAGGVVVECEAHFGSEVPGFAYRWLWPDGGIVPAAHMNAAMDGHVWQNKKPVAMFQMFNSGPDGVVISYMVHPNLSVCAEGPARNGVLGAISYEGRAVYLNGVLCRACTPGTVITSDEVHAGVLAVHSSTAAMRTPVTGTWKYIMPPPGTLPLKTSLREYMGMVRHLERMGFRTSTGSLYLPTPIAPMEEK